MLSGRLGTDEVHRGWMALALRETNMEVSQDDRLADSKQTHHLVPGVTGSTQDE